MRVAVIGGGYAGMAAAVTLADAGVPVTVFEAGPHLGGRARRVIVNDVALDNGLHILIGAYSETLRLVRALHPKPNDALMRFPIDWRVHKHFRLKAVPLPAPLHLVGGLLTANGAPWRERWRAASFIQAMRRQHFRLARDTTVTELLAANGQGPALTRYFWEPLCLAALNTPPPMASAQIFLNVLRDGLNAEASASDILLARVDLSSLLPDPAAVYVRARGGEILTGQTVDAIEHDAYGVEVRTRERSRWYSHAICAVSPHRAVALLARLPDLAPVVSILQCFRYQPIYSIFLQFSESVRMPAPMLGLTGIAQWAFDREAICGQRGLLAAVISGEGAHQNVTQDELASDVHRQLEAELGSLPPLSWRRVIAEKRATFQCSVGLERPPVRTALPRICLAGDYTASDYPATLEAAVRSGIAAGQCVLAQA